MQKAKKKNIPKPKTNPKKSKKVKTPSKQILKYPKKIKGEYFCKYCPKKFSFSNNKYSHQKHCIIGKSLGWVKWQTILSYSKKIADIRETIKKEDEKSLNCKNNMDQPASNFFYRNRIPNSIRKELEMGEDENNDEDNSIN